MPLYPNLTQTHLIKIFLAASSWIKHCRASIHWNSRLWRNLFVAARVLDPAPGLAHSFLGDVHVHQRWTLSDHALRGQRRLGAQDSLRAEARQRDVRVPGNGTTRTRFNTMTRILVFYNCVSKIGSGHAKEHSRIKHTTIRYSEALFSTYLEYDHIFQIIISMLAYLWHDVCIQLSTNILRRCLKCNPDSFDRILYVLPDIQALYINGNKKYKLPLLKTIGLTSYLLSSCVQLAHI